MVVLDIFWHLQNFESGNTFMESKHKLLASLENTYIEISRDCLESR
jgi:hypothetical protein